MATSTGRDGALPGTGGPGGTAAKKEDKGLVGTGHLEAPSPADYAPSKESLMTHGDVERAAPAQPVTAAKQQMEEERGQTFTSASGKPTQPSATNM